MSEFQHKSGKESISCPHRRRMTAGSVGVDLLLPLAAAVLIPLWATGLPLIEAWPRMVTAVPDIAMSLAVLCGGLVTLA
ncbi:hypothetical protein [Mycetocola miduiensis]|uniref:hypothetical protein n=1 Tax=Mycetocola miduiensis TaxID=995034 RepID=UPI0015A687BF|nr:hypothetical protein [Mycetocola miduiensis]